MRPIEPFFTGSILLLLLMFTALACSSTQQLQEEDARAMFAAPESDLTAITDETYRINAGDEIEILVWEQPNFNTLTTVSNNGTIAVPLVGEMMISGLTQAEFERELTRQLSEYIAGDINLTVSIRNTDHLMVAVYGMVARPDNYPVVGSAPLFKVLSTAGGPSEQANIRSVRIYRRGGNPNSVTLDLTQYLDSGRMNSEELMVNAGDIVYVPRKENAVREMSDFLRDIVMLFGIFRIFR